MCSQRQNKVVELIRGLFAVDDDRTIVIFQLLPEVTTAGVADVSHVFSLTLVEDKVTERGFESTVGGDRWCPLLITVGKVCTPAELHNCGMFS